MPPTAPSAGVDHRTRLFVVGDPISHSLSPAIHRAAYASLGLEWSYMAARVPRGSLADFLTEAAARQEDRAGELRGLSVTMPLKPEALARADSSSELAQRTGIANTLVRLPGDSDGAWFADNTDVGGIVAAVNHLPRPSTVAIVGSGATAVSAAVASAQLGCAQMTVFSRNADAAEHIRALVGPLGVEVTVRSLSEEVTGDAVINTLPAEAHDPFVARPAPDSWLLQVAYSGHDSAMLAHWRRDGGVIVSGLEMLLSQALLQVRLFVSGDVSLALPQEQRVWAAMRAAVGAADPRVTL